MNRPTRLAALLVSAPLSLGLAACGSSPSSAPPPSGASTPAASPSQTGTAAGDQSAQDVLSSAVSAEQARRTVHVAMSGGSSGAMIRETGDAEVLGSSPKLDLTLVVSGHRLRMIFVNGTIYMSGIPGTSRKFVKIDSSNPMMSQIASSLNNLDPKATLKAEKAALRSSKHLGSATVDGVTCQHYRLTLDTAKAVQAQLKSMPLLRSHLKQALASLPKTTTSDVWIGPDHLPRKATSGLASAPVTIYFSKWGQPVHITAPPSSQVTSMPGM